MTLAKSAARYLRAENEGKKTFQKKKAKDWKRLMDKKAKG